MHAIELILNAMRAAEVDLSAWVLAWGRVLPTVLIVPAFGVQALPGPARAVLGLALGWCVAPALSQHLANVPIGVQSAVVSYSLAGAFVMELLRGLPPALSAAAMLWAAMMAGGVSDDLRGAQPAGASLFAGAPTPFATLFGLFASVAFLKLGGAANLVEALTASSMREPVVFVGAVRAIVSSVQIALALAAPILGAVMVWEVAAALITRAAAPAYLQSVVAPARSLVILVVMALSLEQLLTMIARGVAA